MYKIDDCMASSFSVVLVVFDVDCRLSILACRVEAIHLVLFVLC